MAGSCEFKASLVSQSKFQGRQDYTEKAHLKTNKQKTQQTW